MLSAAHVRRIRIEGKSILYRGKLSAERVARSLEVEDLVRTFRQQAEIGKVNGICFVPVADFYFHAPIVYIQSHIGIVHVVFVVIFEIQSNRRPAGHLIVFRVRVIKHKSSENAVQSQYFILLRIYVERHDIVLFSVYIQSADCENSIVSRQNSFINALSSLYLFVYE